LVALNLDVTELKAAELEAQKFNLLINTSQDFIVFINMDQTITKKITNSGKNGQMFQWRMPPA